MLINRFAGLLFVAFLILAACTQTEATLPRPLNIDHPIIINGCDIRYQGRPINLGAHIESWVDVLGTYDRKVNLANDVYVWDQIGLKVLSLPGRERAEEMAIVFNIEKSNIDDLPEITSDPDMIEFKRKARSARPKLMYNGSFILDGLPFDQVFDLDASNASRIKADIKQALFHRTYVNYRFQFERDCGNKEFAYVVHTHSKDVNRVTIFTVGITN